MFRLYFPSMPYVHDAIFRQLVADALGRETIKEPFIDVNKDELEKLKKNLTPDLLIKGNNPFNNDWTRYSLSRSKIHAIYSSKKPKFHQIFSSNTLMEISHELQNSNRYFPEFVSFLGTIVNQMQITPEAKGNRCDECGGFFDFFGDSRPRTPHIFKNVWPTQYKYTPGRLRFALTETDPEKIRSRMGNSYLNLLCPICTWKEIIETVVIHDFEPPEKHFLVIFEVTGVDNEPIERLAINLAYRFKHPPNYSKTVSGKSDTKLRTKFDGNEIVQLEFTEDEFDLEDLIDEIDEGSFKIISANGKIFLIINASGLVLNYKTKRQRKNIKMNNYVDPNLRLKKEANLLYSLIVKALESLTLDGEPLGKKIRLFQVTDIGLNLIDTSKASSVYRLMAFAEEKIGSVHPFFRSEAKFAKPLIRWRQIERFLKNPVSEFGKSMRFTYAEINSDSKKKKNLKSNTNKKSKARYDFKTLVETYYEMVKPIMTKDSKEMEFVTKFTEFLYGLPVENDNKPLAKWKEIKAKRQESSYEAPLRDFFRIIRKQSTIEQGIAEFMTKLSRQGMDLSKLDMSKVDEFQEYCKNTLPNIDERNAINISMFVIYRNLSNLAGEKQNE